VPRHPFRRPRGHLVEIEIDSVALRSNLLGDPHCRTVAVYLPEGYHDSAEHYPLLVDLVGYTGSGLSHLNWRAFSESVPQRVDRLVADGKMGPVIVALPDGFTSLGGNQYIDSVVMGAWEAFLVDELPAALEARFRVRPGREHRAVFGKSSGGYGALVHGMRHADAWAAVACHSGDVDFDLLYRRDFPTTLDALARYDGSVERFLAHLDEGHRVEGKDFHVLMILAMAATYDPDPAAFRGIRLPVDPHTCQLDEAAWARWLRHDPLRMVEVPAHQEALCSLRGLFIDVGSRDQYAIHYGTRALVRRLEQLDIPHHYEEFDGTHSGIDHRMDVSLPWLYRALTG